MVWKALVRYNFVLFLTFLHVSILVALTCTIFTLFSQTFKEDGSMEPPREEGKTHISAADAVGGGGGVKWEHL